MSIISHLPKWLKKPYCCLRTFLWNLRDGFRFSVKGLSKEFASLTNSVQGLQEAQNRRRLDDDLLIETIMYEIPNSPVKRPKIRTAEQTINELLGANKSIARFGDGEIIVADGCGIPFQRADETLARRLREILAKPPKDLLIAINRRYYYPNIFESVIKQTNPIYKEFDLYAVPKLRRQLDKYINLDFVYYEAGGLAGWFEAFREFFTGKKLVLVGCKEAFEGYEFNIFDTAAQLCYEFVPNKHAFSEYEGILTRLKAYGADFVHILMCGPTACVLAADLCADGRRALDLGHLAKSYDWHKRGINLNDNDRQNAVKFFAPDE